MVAINYIHCCVGLKASHTNANPFLPEDALKYSKDFKNRYEWLKEDINRLHFDIDGKNLSQELTENEFLDMDTNVKNTLQTAFENQSYCLMTASSYQQRIISWRVNITNAKTSRKKNKEIAEELQAQIELPEGINFDTGIYTNNRKMRMLYSNKDNENRPLRLVYGNPIDTLISYTEECELIEDTKCKVGRPKKVKELECMKILLTLPKDKINEYGVWIELGMMICNEGGTIEDWDTLSKGSKYNRKALELKWKSFTKHNFMFLMFLEKHFPTEYELEKRNSYDFTKTEFETEYAKLMNPPIFIRIQDEIQQLSYQELLHQHRNKIINDEIFVLKWVADPNIKTYEKMGFYPKQPVPENCFNMFRGFAIEPKEGDIRSVIKLLHIIANHDEKVIDYLTKYFAYIFQTCKKTGVVIVVQSNEQGVGKDTFFNFIGSILGSNHFFNTDSPQNNVFHNFNSGTETALLVKFEEAVFNPSTISSFKSKINCPTEKYVKKGKEAITLADHRNFVITTNNEQVVAVEPSDRRFLLLNPSAEKKDDTDFWNEIHSDFAKPETKSAFYHYLLNVDISNFNPEKDRVETDYYREAKLAFAPYHATFLQRFVEESGKDEIEISAYSLLDKINDGAKFPKGARKLGLDMKTYIAENVVIKGHCRTGNSYIINADRLKTYLLSKGWWVEM